MIMDENSTKVTGSNLQQNVPGS